MAYESLGGDTVADKEFIIRTVDAACAGKIPSSIPVLAEKLGVPDDVWANANLSASTINHDLLDYVLELRSTYKQQCSVTLVLVESRGFLIQDS